MKYGETQEWNKLFLIDFWNAGFIGVIRISLVFFFCSRCSLNPRQAPYPMMYSLCESMCVMLYRPHYNGGGGGMPSGGGGMPSGGGGIPSGGGGIPSGGGGIGGGA